MIAYPIGYPIGSHRVDPNRPRIARVVSAHTHKNLTVPSHPQVVATTHGMGASR